MIYFDQKIGQLVASHQDQVLVSQGLAEAHRLLAVDSRAHADLMRSLGQAILEPIKVFSDYVEAFGDVFMDAPDRDWNEPAAYPIETRDAVVRESAIDGQFYAVRVGLRWGSMGFFRIDSGFSVHEADLRRASYDLVARQIDLVGQEMARKRDAKAMAALDAVAATVTGHTPTVVGGAITKAAVDAIFDDAVNIGYQITRVKINAADVNRMRDWPNDPFQAGPGTEELFNRGFIGNYGGATWQATRSIPKYVPGQVQGKVYFLAQPERLGYRRYMQRMRQITYTDVVKRETQYLFDEILGIAAVNGYAVYVLTIAD